MNRSEASSEAPIEDNAHTIGTAEQHERITSAYNAWNKWRGYDHTAQYRLGFQEREELAAKCLDDAKLCRETAEISVVSEQHKTLTEAARELQLNALFLVPEVATEKKIDAAINLGVDMIKARHQEGWHAEDLDKYIKLYDLQHLIAFWEASLGEQEGAPERKEVAKAILGASIIDSAEDINQIMQVSKQLGESDDPRMEGTQADLNGHAAEFLLLTATRLNLLFQGKLDQLILRSAFSMEDANNTAGKPISADMTVHAPHEDEVRFVQCKSGKRVGRDYAPHITKVHVNWENVARDPEWALFLLGEFTETDNKYIQEDLIQELNQLMGLGRVIKRHDNPSLNDLLAVN